MAEAMQALRVKPGLPHLIEMLVFYTIHNASLWQGHAKRPYFPLFVHHFQYTIFIKLHLHENKRKIFIVSFEYDDRDDNHHEQESAVRL